MDQIVGTVSAVSGSACLVTVRDEDMPAAIPLGVTAIQVGDTVALLPIGQSWYVNAVMPRPSL